MATFMLFGKYSPESLEKVEASRTQEAKALIEKSGGKVLGMYVLLGEQDLVFIIELPGITQAMAISAELFKLTGISFTTSPAITVKEFDELMGK